MTDINGIFNAISRRDPSKRQIKPVNTDTLALLDDLDDDSDSEYLCDANATESSGDEENSCESPSSSGSDGSGTDSEDEDEEDKEGQQTGYSLEQTTLTNEENNDDSSKIEYANLPNADKCNTGSEPKTLVPVKASKQPLDFMVCTLCLGDFNDPNDELIECDGCGIVVHEDCYKVIDSIFMSSGASSSSTDAWFCEPCLAGVSQPLCELCPNRDGAFKKTDNNRWIHLLCALYTPGVAFNDAENLMDVTLTELPLKVWSQHECSLCDERFFAWTGVCISCDAGLCRTFFHVTCAQKHGLLSEPMLDEHTVDPYFAQCRQHTDKSVARQRRRNYIAAMSRVKAWRLKNIVNGDRPESQSLMSPTSGLPQTVQAWAIDSRLERKLNGFRTLYQDLLKLREKPYVPTSKTPLYLETTPVAMRLFFTKAKALHLPTELVGQSANSETTRNPSSGYPVFSPDFISYFFEREKRINEVVKHISYLQNSQRELQIADADASHSYNSVSTELEAVNKKRGEVYDTCRGIFTIIESLLPIKSSAELASLFSARNPGIPNSADGNLEQPETASASLPTSQGRQALQLRKGLLHQRAQAARLPGAGLMDRERLNPDIHIANDRLQMESVIMSCFVCQGIHEQHLITKCDTCVKAFHLACLDPPLLRMPKRSRLYAWQCSYCTKAVAAQSEVVTVDVNAPRQLRRSVGPSLASSLAAPLPAATTVAARRGSVQQMDQHRRASSAEAESVGKPTGAFDRQIKPEEEEKEEDEEETGLQAGRGQRPLSPGSQRKQSLQSTTELNNDDGHGEGGQSVAGHSQKLSGARQRMPISLTSTCGAFNATTTNTTRVRVLRGGTSDRRRRSTGNPLASTSFTAVHPAKRARSRSSDCKPAKDLSFGAADPPKPEGDVATITTTTSGSSNNNNNNNNSMNQKDAQKLAAYDYSQEQNSDDYGTRDVGEAIRPHTSKVIKFVHICADGDGVGKTGRVEQISPLYPQGLQRYVICRDTASSSLTESTGLVNQTVSGGGDLGSPRKSSLERFRMKLKKV